MTLGKSFMTKQSIIIYKIYKQALVVWNRVSFSTNALHACSPSLPEKALDKLLFGLFIYSTAALGLSDISTKFLEIYQILATLFFRKQ